MSSPDSSLPLTSDELTPEWLTQALRSTGTLQSAVVTSFTKETIGEGVGVLGELVRVTPVYDRLDPDAPTTFVAKFASAAEENRAIANMLGFYTNEVQFYTTLAPHLPIHVPKCYYVAIDDSTYQFVLLIEDFGGMRIGDQVAGCTPEEAGALVTAIGKVHAQTWNANLPDGADWARRVSGEHFTIPVPGIFSMSWPGTVANFGKLIPYQLKGLGEVYPAACPRMLERLGADPVCYVHGDYRLDNVFYGDTLDDIGLIDWQISGLARGPYDVGYLMSQSINVDDRRSSEKGIIEAYHKTLVDGGVTGYSIDDVWRDYRRAIMHCVVYPVTVTGGMELANERGVALAEAMATRSFTAVLDHNATQFMED